LAADVERPTRIVWDLDPGPEIEWRPVIAAAKQVRDVLDALGLRTWVKTTGGRGLHVVLPLRPERDWAVCLAFARNVAEALVRSAPDRYTIAFAKRGRQRKILIDYLRNNRTNTSICAFSTRARPGAPVSMPISWSETARLTPPAFTMQTTLQRVGRLRRDPWVDYWPCRQRLSNAVLRAARQV
jgi:bifunctional non-homologous end joining protein LigD